MRRRYYSAWAAVAVLAVPVLSAHAQPPAADQPTLPKETITAPPVVVPPATEQPTTPGAPISWSAEKPSDTTLVGSYNQPQWTTQRPFTTTRAYVIPEGTMVLEQWYRPRWHRDGTREDRLLEEFEVGLPYRFQLDIYERWNIHQDDNGHYNAFHEGNQIELRWAIANWGVIPLNPTLYAEWIQRGNSEGEPDKYELKLLLADSFFHDKLYFAGNFIIEKEVGGEKENELGYSQAFATTIIDGKLLGGVEMIYRAQNVHGDRGTWNNEFLIGPSFQWRPTNRTFLDVTGLFGCTPGSPRAEMYVIFGYQFGKRAGPSNNFQGINPVTLGN